MAEWARVIRDVNCRNGINLLSWFVSSVIVFARVDGATSESLCVIPPDALLLIILVALYNAVQATGK